MTDAIPAPASASVRAAASDWGVDFELTLVAICSTTEL